MQNNDSRSSATGPRLWPGLFLLALIGIGRFVLPVAVPEVAMFGFLGALVCILLLLVWWLLFSRLPWSDRLLGLGALAVCLFLGRMMQHESLGTASYGIQYFIVAMLSVSVALVLWTAVFAQSAPAMRRLALLGLLAVSTWSWGLVRLNGLDGNFDSDYAWRWSATAEDRLLAGEVEGSVSGTGRGVDTGAGWSGFRGPARDSRLSGTRIATDWQTSPPQEIWRRPVGPGWSSFAVRGGLIYTQEQRGDEEVVAAYRASNGEPVWQHADDARFWEAIGGAGPRGTPTLAGDLVLSLGATGILNALDAETGAVRWSRDTVEDTGASIPGWGISASPLVWDDAVIVAASGIPAAYQLATGEKLWIGPKGGGGESYSSPHRLPVVGLEGGERADQVLLLRPEGLLGLDPETGAELWSHEWGGVPIVQPAITDDGDVLVAVSDRSGLRRLSLERDGSGWRLEEDWTSIRLKPYFNDFVVHRGRAYGFDGRILACVDLSNGERVWKGGRYGNGQLVLLEDQDLLLVLSEDGELALVKASPDGYEEVAKVEALEGKTWNHPVLVGDVLLVRNSEEMAAFRLAQEV